MLDGMYLPIAAGVLLVLYLLRRKSRLRREDSLIMREYDL